MAARRGGARRRRLVGRRGGRPLAVAASLLWGAADYLGGAAGRRLPVLAVVLVSQAAGLVAIVAVAAVAEPDGPSARALAAGALAGAVGVISAPCFYRALARGPMSVVAPIVATSAWCRPRSGWRAASGRARWPSPAWRRRSRASCWPRASPAPAARIPLPTVGAGARGDALPRAPARLPRRGSRRGRAALGRRRRPAPRASPCSAPSRCSAGRTSTARRSAPWRPSGCSTPARTRASPSRAGRGDLATAAVLGSLFPVVTVLIAHVRLGERLAGWQAVGAALAVGGALVVVGATA